MGQSLLILTSWLQIWRELFSHRWVIFELLLGYDGDGDSTSVHVVDATQVSRSKSRTYVEDIAKTVVSKHRTIAVLTCCS